MTLTLKMVDNRVAKIQKLQSMIDELTAQMESVKDELKQYMTDSNIEDLETGNHSIKYMLVAKNSIDSKTLKAELPDVYIKYCKATNYKRFSIA